MTFYSAGFLPVFALTLVPGLRQAAFGAILNFINGTPGWLYVIDFDIFVAAAAVASGQWPTRTSWTTIPPSLPPTSDRGIVEMWFDPGSFASYPSIAAQSVRACYEH